MSKPSTIEVRLEAARIAVCRIRHVDDTPKRWADPKTGNPQMALEIERALNRIVRQLEKSAVAFA